MFRNDFILTIVKEIRLSNFLILANPSCVQPSPTRDAHNRIDSDSGRRSNCWHRPDHNCVGTDRSFWAPPPYPPPARRLQMQPEAGTGPIANKISFRFVYRLIHKLLNIDTGSVVFCFEWASSIGSILCMGLILSRVLCSLTFIFKYMYLCLLFGCIQ